MPESKALAPDIQTIKRAVCKTCKVKPEDLLISKRGTTNVDRNVAIYLIRQYAGEKLERKGERARKVR